MTETKRISVELGDLFFNYEHPHYEYVSRAVNYAIVMPDLRAAILRDAKAFVTDFGDGRLIPEMADVAAEDFMRRI